MNRIAPLLRGPGWAVVALALACNTSKDGPQGGDPGPDSGETAAADGADGTGSETGSPDPDGTDGADGSDGTDGTTDPVTATLTGSVQVELFCTDEAGGREAVSFEEAYGGVYPFGPIWVAAYDEVTGSLGSYGSELLATPGTGGNAFSFEVALPSERDLRVFAILDRDADRIMASSDPIGTYPDLVAAADGDTLTGLDFSIVTYAGDSWCGSNGGDSGSGGSGSGGSGSGGSGGSGSGGSGSGGSGSGGSGSGGSGTGGTTTEITISGDIEIGDFYTSGAAAVMLLDMEGAGPDHYDVLTPTSTSSGAEGAYTFTADAGLGQMQLVGVVDSNNNSVFDSSDTWGAYAVVEDINANPILVQSSDLSGLRVQIPLGEGDSPLSLVPYTTVSGTIDMDDGSSFDSLTSGTSLYIVALQYRPNLGTSVTQLEADSYDLEEVDWADLTGRSSITYDLTVPSNTVAYLWVYADEDVDGTVQESGEALASGGLDDNGRQPIGTASITQDFSLLWPSAR